MLGFNTKAYAVGKEPKSWAEFWDTKAFPGPRTLADMASGAPNLEIALIADGVPMDKVYPIDIDRAFKSLSRIKASVPKFWDTGALAAQMLADKEAAMGVIWSTRAQVAADGGAPVGVAVEPESDPGAGLRTDQGNAQRGGRHQVHRLQPQPRGPGALARPVQGHSRQPEGLSQHRAAAARSGDQAALDQVERLPERHRMVGREPHEGERDLEQVGSAISTGAVGLDGLCKSYGEERVVDSIRAAIRPGEFFSLLGPSGSGKTTTLMMIAGFVAPDAGTIRVDDIDITHLPPQRRGLGMVFQNYAIFPHLNVFENVAFPLRARRVAGSGAAPARAGGAGAGAARAFRERYARQLSGGQQQRVAIARAIVFHPSIVLMDEPLGALDKNLRYEMQVEIKEIQQRLGMTVIYVTHDQEEAMNMSDRMAIMNGGRIEQIGPPGEIYERPANAFVGRFLGEANLIEGTIEQSATARRRCARATAMRCGHGSSVPRQWAQPAALFVRPEKLAFGDGPGEANRLTARYGGGRFSAA